MSTLRDRLCDRKPPERDGFETKLKILASKSTNYRHAVDNLKRESRLSEDAWDELIAVTLDASPEPEAIRYAMLATFRNHTLEAPSVKHRPRSRVYGRAVGMHKLSETLATGGRSTESASLEIESLLDRKVSARRLRKLWRHRPLGQHLMWSTFDPDNDEGDPFDRATMPKTKDGICAVLGLPVSVSDDDSTLVLLRYTLPEGVEPGYPTVADAYSGVPWPYFFHPADEDQPHGWTMAWPSHDGEPASPEVVHKVINGPNLAGPLQELP